MHRLHCHIWEHNAIGTKIIVEYGLYPRYFSVYILFSFLLTANKYGIVSQQQAAGFPMVQRMESYTQQKVQWMQPNQLSMPQQISTSMLLILHKTRSTPPQKLSRQFNILTYLSLFILYLTLDTETLTRINKVIQQYLLSNYQGYLLFICLPSYLNFPTRPNYQKPLHFSFHWRYIWLSTRSSAYVSFLYIYE